MQTKTRSKKKFSRHPVELIITLVVSLCLLLTATASGNYQDEDPPATATESILTDEPVAEKPTDDQSPATEPVATQTPVEAKAQPKEPEEETVEILIGLKKNKFPEGLIPERVNSDGKAWKFSNNSELEKLNIFVLNVPASKMQEEMQRIQNLSGVSYVEPNYRLEGTDTIPNDPSFSSQYALTAIHAPQGWDISTGATTVTIAIVDSGVDYGHAELVGKLVGGHDFVRNDNIADDEHGHGTHVAGIAAASSNNGLGIAGVSWGARIMPVKVLDATNSGNVDDIAAGIIWAADNGAQIINLSLGGPSPSITLENAVNYATGMGTLLIAAAGNGGFNSVFYPAHYPAVMAVAATDASNQPITTSNYGPEMEVAAPGDSIYSLDIGGYTTRTGTSMAAAHVSGLAAILWGQAGYGSASSVRWGIESTALDIDPPGWDSYTGAGLIQMDAALGATPIATATFTAVPISTPAEETNSSPVQGYPFPQPGVIATWTSASATGISITPTFTSTATDTSSATIISSLTSPENILYTPTPEVRMSGQSNPQNGWWGRLQVLFSPLFCGGILLVLVGLLWVWFAIQRQRRRLDTKVTLGSYRSYSSK